MTYFCRCFSLAVLTLLPCAKAEDHLWFGTINERGKTIQARFEVSKEGGQLRKILLAPYGLTPTEFNLLKHDDGELHFSFTQHSRTYQCVLRKESTPSFRGSCLGTGSESLSMVMRDFTPEDAVLQGNSRTADKQDIAIANRARELLSEGRAWNRRDDRICDTSRYPYKWSLFCALHQASIEIATQYEHLRPVMKAVRKAITDRHPGRNFAHTLRDFNNEAPDFRTISEVLEEAKTILMKQSR